MAKIIRDGHLRREVEKRLLEDKLVSDYEDVEQTSLTDHEKKELVKNNLSLFVVKLNAGYWDCECLEDYVHAKNVGDFCPLCGAFEEDQPDSRQDEINSYYDPRYDIVVFFKERYREVGRWTD